MRLAHLPEGWGEAWPNEPDVPVQGEGACTATEPQRARREKRKAKTALRSRLSASLRPGTTQ